MRVFLLLALIFLPAVALAGPPSDQQLTEAAAAMYRGEALFWQMQAQRTAADDENRLKWVLDNWVPKPAAPAMEKPSGK